MRSSVREAILRDLLYGPVPADFAEIARRHSVTADDVRDVDRSYVEGEEDRWPTK